MKATAPGLSGHPREKDRDSNGCYPCQCFVSSILKKIIAGQFLLIIGFGIIVIFCGFFGYAEYYSRQPEGVVSTLDLLYMSLQLFVLETTNSLIQPPALLEFARFAAPALAAFTIVTLLVRVFWSRVQSLRIWTGWWQPKAIICGLGYLGPRYVREIRKRGYRTVVIEKNPTSADNDCGISEGSFFLKGDATDPSLLQRVHLRNHDVMVLVTGDDATNIQIAMTVKELLKTAGCRDKDAISSAHSDREKHPIILIHVEDRWLSNAVKEHPGSFFQAPMTIIPFNMYFNAASELVPYIWDSSLRTENPDHISGDHHVLLIGVGTMGEEIIKGLITRWENERTDPNRRKAVLYITFIDYKDTGDKEDRMNLWMAEKGYPKTSVSFAPYSMKIPSAEFMKGEFLPADGSRPPVSSVVICLANQTLAMTSAIEMNPIITRNIKKSSTPERKLPPVFVRFVRDNEITKFCDLLHDQASYSNIKPYTVVEYGWCWNEELEKRFPEKPCYCRSICPWNCEIKERMQRPG